MESVALSYETLSKGLLDYIDSKLWSFGDLKVQRGVSS